jgi:carboxymethylenebutenolidase
MLIQESFHDVPTKVDGNGTMRIYVFHPTIPGYPKARFPGVVVFSEIYQVTGPVSRFARQIAGQGYICAAPSSYHEFTGPEPLQYNAEDTDKGNQWKVSKVCTHKPSHHHGRLCLSVANRDVENSRL